MSSQTDHSVLLIGFIVTYNHMYVCAYLKFEGASTSQVIGARNEWWVMMIMMGPKASWHFSYRWGKPPKKTLTQETCPDRDRTRARCVTGTHATTCPTAVDLQPHLNWFCPLWNLLWLTETLQFKSPKRFWEFLNDKLHNIDYYNDRYIAVFHLKILKI